MPRVLDQRVLLKTDSGGVVSVEVNLAGPALDAVVELGARWMVG